VVFSCLEKEAGRRMPSVAELARALERFAPLASAGAASRIATVAQGGVTLKSTNDPATGDSSSKRVPVSGGTSVAWGETQLATAPKKRGAWLAAVGGIVVLALLGAIAFITIKLRVQSAAAPPSTAELEQFPPTRQIELSPPPPTPLSQTITPAPTETPPPAEIVPALPASAPMPTATHRTPISTPSPARQPGTVQPKPKPAHTSDDMPSERN
jgi:hypothetical protein